MIMYDVIVVGLGAMGSAACFHLAKQGAKVLGLDQFQTPHALGSTHGDTRITRLGLGEGNEFVPFAVRSHELWRELEQATGEKILHQTGGLFMEKPGATLGDKPSFLEQTITAATEFSVPYVLPDLQTNPVEPFGTSNEKAYFEQSAGYLVPEQCVELQLQQATKLEAVIKNEKVTRIDHQKGIVHTQTSSYKANRIILTAGPWMPDFLEKPLSIHRQVLYWFDVEEHYEAFSKMPVFIWILDPDKSEGIYGFPAINGPKGGFKVAISSYQEVTTPSSINRVVSKREIQEMFDAFVRPQFPMLSGKCVKTATCMYTVTPDESFVIDRYLGKTIVASACSGHGFKHSAAIGETLAELSQSITPSLDISAFRLNRF